MKVCVEKKVKRPKLPESECERKLSEEQKEALKKMVNILVDRPTFRDHVGYNIIHWIISQSGMLYTKFNENIQHNLRTIESGVAVIDEILTPQDEDEFFYENNNQYIDRLYFYHNNNALNRRMNPMNDNFYVNGNENDVANQFHFGMYKYAPFDFAIIFVCAECSKFLFFLLTHATRERRRERKNVI